MSDVKAAWEQVGSTFSGLGMKLRLHFEQARSDEADAAAPEATGDGPPGGPAGGAGPTGPAYAPPTEPGAATAASEADATEASGAEAGTGGGGGAREDVKEALRKLGAAIDDAFEAMGAAAKDPAVKDDVRQVGQSLTGALSATFADVSDDLRRVLRRNKGDDPADKGDGPTDKGGGAAG